MVRLIVNIDVDDLEKGIEFYRAALGLVLKRRLFDGTVAELTGAASPVFLLAKAAGSAATDAAAAVRDYRRHWTPVHLDVAVGDLSAAIRRAQTAGAILEGDVQTFPWGRIAFLSDPFGHGFCLLHYTAHGHGDST